MNELLWNYRVIRTKYAGETIDAVHEVYYDEKKNIIGFSDDPVYPLHIVGFDPKDMNMTVQMEMYASAVEKPLLHRQKLEKRIGRLKRIAKMSADMRKVYEAKTIKSN